MMRFLWAFLLFLLGLVWLQITDNTWLHASVVLHHHQTEIETSLWIVLVGIFLIAVVVYTLVSIWYGIAALLNQGQMNRAIKTQSAWEEALTRLLLGDWRKAQQILKKIQKKSDTGAGLAQILVALLQGLLPESAQDALSEQYFSAEDWLKLQMPRAMLLQWSSAMPEANALWQQICHRETCSVALLKLWLNNIMSMNETGANLSAGAEIYHQFRGAMVKHYPKFSHRVQIYLFAHDAFATTDTIMLEWKSMSRIFRKCPQVQCAYVQALQRCGAHDRAATFLEQEVPKSWDTHLCDCYVETMAPPQHQIKIFNRWLKFAPSSCLLSLHQGLAYAYARCGLWDQVRQILEAETLELPYNSLGDKLLALAYMQMHQYHSAHQLLLNGFTLPLSQQETD